MSGVSSAKSKMTSSIGLAFLSALVPSLLSGATFIGNWKSLSSQLILSSGRELMQNIAKRHGCDPQICNPSRIMRLGGTVSYPSKAKRARGYQIELTAFYEYGGGHG